MKVHLISNMYPNKSAPNYGVFVKNTEEILTSAGFKVDITVMTKSTSKWRKLIKYGMYYLAIIWKGTSKKYDVTYVHYASHNAFPLLLLNKINKKLVIYTNVHGSDVVPEVSSQEKYQGLVKKLLDISTVVITPSNYYRELVKEKYSLTNQIEIFPSGGVNKKVFFERTDGDHHKHELGLDLSKKYIGYVSRLDVGKGWDILLDAFNTLISESRIDEDISLLVVGDGKERGAFDEKVNKYNLENRIVYFPLLSQNKLNLIYNSIEIFSFPTTRKGESLGLVGLEAMACGVPVVGSAIGGLLDYIEDEKNGLLFHAGSSEDLANKIEQYFSLSIEEQKKLAANAKEKANEYEVNSIKHKLIEIFQ